MVWVDLQHVTVALPGHTRHVHERILGYTSKCVILDIGMNNMKYNKCSIIGSKAQRNSMSVNDQFKFVSTPLGHGIIHSTNTQRVRRSPDSS